MNPPLIYKILLNIITYSLLLSGLTACGGGGSTTSPPIDDPSVPVAIVPVNQINYSLFRDLDDSEGKISGVITLEATEINETDPARVESVWVYWLDEQGNKKGEAWLKTDENAPYNIDISEGTSIPENTTGFLLTPTNAVGQANISSPVYFHDFIGNTQLSGPGGNESESWEYGVERSTISIYRSNRQGGLCVFDNGLVSVTDMENTRDQDWENRLGNTQTNEVNEAAFPAYSFLCDEQPTHNLDTITDEVGVWTYSTLNDAMFYGTIVYDTFNKYLGSPPLKDKIRLRVHYGYQYETTAYWDGAYANFGDAYGFMYSTASLDTIAHEVAHGVLNRLSDLDFFELDISEDARTLHEAFGDISGVMAKYEFTGELDNWVHAEESHGLTRHLDRIKTEEEAIDSFLDYQDAGDNFYLRIGMITYPFYLLSYEWGLENAYRVYIHSAKTCWHAQTTLTEAAQCIKESAGNAGLPEEDVETAFKTVKIQLFDNGALSHFTAEKFKLRTKFVDNSRSTNLVTDWYWDFGDGQSSTEANPEHTFAEEGIYSVKLTVTDQSNDQDTFERRIEVSEQYCPIRTFETNNHITSVSVSGHDINYDASRWDYTQTPIELAELNNLTINIEGNSQQTQRSTTWKVWIDLNNNGIYGDIPDEIILNEFVAEGLSYALLANLDLGGLQNNGSAKYMRVIGDYAVNNSCSGSVGKAFDLKIIW